MTVCIYHCLETNGGPNLVLDGIFEMANLIKNLFKRKTKNNERKLSKKEIANASGEPYIDIVQINLDENDPSNGSFEFDWNDIFIARLIKAGYPGKTDADIVDNWYRTISKNVAMELWEQEQADPDKRR